MATYDQAIQALRAADAAGNTEDAKKLAVIASRLKPKTNVQEEQPQERAGMVKGVTNELKQGATFGFSDEIEAVLGAAMAAPFVSDKTFRELYKEARDAGRKDMQQFREESPGVALASNIAGGVATGSALFKGAQTTAQLAKTGAATGTVAGAGFSDSDKFLSADTATDAAITGAASAGLGPLTPAFIKGIASAGKLIPEDLPRKLLETALKFRPSIDTKTREQMTRTALDEGILPTVKGLEKITKTLEGLDARINGIIDTATQRGTLISKKVLFGQLKQLKGKLGGAKLDAGDDLNTVSRVAQALDEQLKKIKKDKLTPREVQDLKTDAYKRINFDMSQGQGNFAKNEARKSIAKSAKEQIEKIDPDVGPINKRMGNLIQLRDELERVVTRLDNRNIISLDTAAKIGAGAATQTGAGTAAGAAASILGAPRVKARVALALENLRKSDAITKQYVDSVSPELAALISTVVGRTQESLRSEIDVLDN